MRHNQGRLYQDEIIWRFECACGFSDEIEYASYDEAFAAAKAHELAAIDS